MNKVCMENVIGPNEYFILLFMSYSTLKYDLKEDTILKSRVFDKLETFHRLVQIW